MPTRRVIAPSANYSARRSSDSILACLRWLFVFALAAVTLLAHADGRHLVMDTGPGQLLDWHWQDASVTVDEDGLAFTLRTLSRGDQDWLDQLHWHCPAVERLAEGCPGGTLSVRGQGLELEAIMALAPGDGHWQVTLVGSHWSGSLRLPIAPEETLKAELILDGWSLEQLPLAWLEPLGLNVLMGQLSGQLALDGERLTAALELVDAGFDSPDGRFAGDGLGVSVEGAGRMDGLGFSGQFTASQSAGEWLLDALYLPSPTEPLRLDLSWDHVWGEGLELTDFQLSDGPALALKGGLSLQPKPEGGWSVKRARVDSGWISLASAWPRWFDGPVGAAGFPDLKTAGRIDLELDWQLDRPLVVSTQLHDLALTDPQGRFAFARVNGQFHQGAAQAGLDVDWVAMALWGLPLGGGRLSLLPESRDADRHAWRLAAPLRVPLLDGAVVVENLLWAPDQERGLTLDARIETLSLTELTRALNWPEFGGQLAAEFPGVVLVGERLDFTGGIDISAFSGSIRLAELAIERPLGTLPAVSAQLEFDRLDLDEVTGAFNFGRMEGQVSGWARNLRLLDWRPVAMDARIFTHEDVPRRRISQRAVDNLTSLGGAGGALINTTVLAVFDDFAYRRAGLACRLANNICHIDGVAAHDSGGFYIVQGRGLPRLDVIGHRRLMDWPQFVGQLEAIID